MFLSKKKLSAVLLAAGIAGTVFMNGNMVDAHGYVEAPYSRAYQGKLDQSSMGWAAAMELYGPIIQEPQSLEAPKGFPKAGPADGQIASAAGVRGFQLDKQTSSIWKKQNIQTGPLSITWRYTAAHRTSKWHYYITKPGWDQNKPLSRDELEEIAVVNHDGSSASNNLTHQINIPKNRLGYHVILAVWDVADTSNAFYNVIDVNVTSDNVIPTPPVKPTGLKATSVTATTATLDWKAQSDADSYNVYRDGKKVAATSSVGYTDSNLTPETAYRYQIEAVGKSGLVSEKSSAISVTTKSESVAEAPTAPTGLHAMGTTTSSIDLMWNASSHTQGIKEYQIFRNGQRIATTSKTEYTDSNLASDTTYSYYVKAVSKTGEISAASNVLSAKTQKEETKPGEYREWKVGSFHSPETYKSGEMVSYKGKNYRTLQTHVNYGDTTWAPDVAPTLFQLVK